MFYLPFGDGKRLARAIVSEAKIQHLRLADREGKHPKNSSRGRRVRFRERGRETPPSQKPPQRNAKAPRAFQRRRYIFACSFRNPAPPTRPLPISCSLPPRRLQTEVR